MRILLFTGKGGVGKTTAAAGTAALAARSGQRTLVMSTDAAHSLADAFGTDAAPGEPTEIEPRLRILQIDAQRRFERSWAEIRTYLSAVLDAVGIDPITTDELTVLPGVEEVLALLELRELARSGEYDVVVVDCAPTAETLRLLALPESLAWYMDRVFPAERRVLKALRPVLAKKSGLPVPGESVLDAVERLHADLLDVQALLTGEGSSVRLVLTPEAVVVAEARRSLTTLSLFGYRVDGVIANRIFPDPGDSEWLRGWVAAQGRILQEVAQSFEPLPVWRAAYHGVEPVGPDPLVAFATQAYAGADPLAEPELADPVLVGPGRGPEETVLSISLPFAQRGDIGLARNGDELVLTVGSYRRLLALPKALTEHQVSGASVGDGRLRVRFRLDQEANP